MTVGGEGDYVRTAKFPTGGAESSPGAAATEGQGARGRVRRPGLSRDSAGPEDGGAQRGYAAPVNAPVRLRRPALAISSALGLSLAASFPASLGAQPWVLSRVDARVDAEGPYGPPHWALGGAPSAAPRSVAGGQELRRELERLSSPRVTERHAAERWLGANLRRTDFAVTAEAARAGDAEVCRRISRALGSDGRHLGLAVLFLSDPAEDLAELGRVAVEDLIRKWDPAAGEAPRSPRNLPPEWVERETRRLSIDLRAGGVATIVDRIERLAPAPATLVLDPGLDPGVYEGLPAPLGTGAPFDGVWPKLIGELGRLHRVGFEVRGFRVPSKGARPWVRIHGRGAKRGADTIELFTDWCRGVVREGDAPWNVACARALASSGWPAAVSWFEDLWLSRDDPAAREGLLLAAARGRVAPSLADPVRLRGLLDVVDADLAARAQGAVARAETLALALASVGPLGADERWTDVLTERWSELGAPSRWVRLVALEGHGRGNARARQLALEEFVRPGSVALRRQALRTLASLSSAARKSELGTESESAPQRPIREPAELFRGTRDELDELGLNLSAAALAWPPGQWYAALSAPDSVLAALAWSLECGDSVSSLALLGQLESSLSTLQIAAELRRWSALAHADSVGALLTYARGQASSPAESTFVERLRLRAGFLGADEQRTALDALLARGELSAEELIDLGSLCASRSVGWRAREALVEAVEADPPLVELEPAVLEALGALARERLDREADVLASRLRTAADGIDHPILARFYRGDWPPPVEVAAIALDTLDRRWE